MLAWTGLALTLAARDVVELTSGAQVEGKILERTEQSVKIEVTVGERKLIRTFPTDRLRSITQEGQKVEFGSSGGAVSKKVPGASELAQRTAADLEAHIDQLGRTPPEWFEQTPLEYPPTLDLTWPEPAPIIWNYTRNVDHYIWDIINSNPKRYQSGVRLMHHLLIVNQQTPAVRNRVMNELGRMYFEFFRDYARAAFWWRQAKVEENPQFASTPSPARLAECYWRLGNRAMAVALLERTPLTAAVIKAWGDLHETGKALELCEAGLKAGLPPSQIYLLAGDACRAARAFDRATGYYEKVLALPQDENESEEIKRDRQRATATMEVIRLFDTLDVSQIPDGAYDGQTLSYSGTLELRVVVKSRRIETIEIQHNPDRQYFHAVDETIRRILSKQTVNGVDAISGATITAEAVVRASAKALAEGMKAVGR